MAPADNLYCHFPFCRRKCRYCALLSRVGRDDGAKAAHVARLVRDLDGAVPGDHVFRTVYFGGGSPALCDLGPVFDALAPHLDGETEFTVELHPLDVTPALLATLRAGGVNRISMGLQSVDDDILAHMNRGYGFMEAERAFAAIRNVFDNAGIDLIVGYPGEKAALLPRHARLAKWGMRHCSAYSLILEPDSVLGRETAAGRAPGCPSDDLTLDRLAITARFLEDLGLARYEISSYAVPGFECRHNLAVWRGEDYLGLGEGASGRLGLARTRQKDDRCETTTVTAEEDAKERALFRLRTRAGIDASDHPSWRPALDRFADEGLLARAGDTYRLTERGTEVCDTILAELV